jgi:hypothetical protein
MFMRQRLLSTLQNRTLMALRIGSDAVCASDRLPAVRGIRHLAGSDKLSTPAGRSTHLFIPG